MKRAEKALIHMFAVLAFTLFVAGCSLLEAPKIAEYTGTKRALIYGVADYAIVNDLTYTYHDALDMDNYLRKAGFSVTLRTDSEVTKAKIFADLQEAALTATEDDLLLFHFSGHGKGSLRDSSTLALSSPLYLELPEQYAGQAAIAPYDVSGSYHEGYYYYNSEQFIFESELLEKLDLIPGKKLLLLDICHGGGFVYDDGITVDSLPKDYEYRDEEESTPAFLRAWESYFTYDGSLVYPDIWVMTSAGAHEAAYEGTYELEGLLYANENDEVELEDLESLGFNTIRNGFFTYYLLESLGFDHVEGTISQTVPADADGNGFITVSELFGETLKRFQDEYNRQKKYLAISVYEPYYPHLSGGSDDLILFHPGDFSR